MINADEARRQIVGAVTPGETEPCSLPSCLNRVLAEDVVASHDIPPFDNSSMDGYAVRSADVGGASNERSVRLTVQGEIAAGRSESRPLRQHHAYRILTGAPIPPEADAVIEQEVTEGLNGAIKVPAGVTSGRNIRRRGEDVKAGSAVLHKGLRLTPSRVGILASIGCVKMTVFRKPVVAVLPTGDELVEASEPLGPGKIRNSNAYTLEGLIAGSGCIPRNLGIARDDESDLREKIVRGLETDALVTSGGVSVGDRDHVLDILKSLGVEIVFWKVNIKPGMPMAFGVFHHPSGRHVPVFALPGNPVSSVVTFLQFVRPGLERIGGLSQSSERMRFPAVLKNDLRKADGKRHFVRGICRNENGGLVVEPTRTQSSGVLTSLSDANCLIVIPEEVRSPKAGDTVEVELL